MVAVGAADGEVSTQGSLGALLEELRGHDIRVEADGGQLRLDAPPGALTPGLRERLVRHKAELLEFLRSAEQLAARPPAIVPLQARGTRAPIYGVGGHNGDVFCYRALSRHLGPEQPFFGLQPPGLLPGTEPLERVGDLARYFADQILAFQPSGACVIAGYCAGGSIAFELACELEARGARVNLLALFAAPYPTWFRTPAQIRSRFFTKLAVMAEIARALASLSWRERSRYLEARLAARRERGEREQQLESSAGHDEVMVLRRRVERATLDGVRRYLPRPYPGRASLFVPGPGWSRIGGPGRGWQRVLRGASEHFGSYGCDADTLLREPHAAAMAQLFARVSHAAASAATSARARVPADGVAQPQ